MFAESTADTYRDAARVWGNGAQRLMFVEEAGEALTALSRYERGRCYADEVVEEMADVVIMAEQVALMYGTSDQYQLIRNRKLNRLIERLDA